MEFRALADFHPLVRGWFESALVTPTRAQSGAWPAIAAGRDTLIAAPTGSGKTLAAFLASVDALVRRALDGGLEDRVHIVYVSPLKALSNDIQTNLEIPLAGIAARAEAEGVWLPRIRTAVRTGDTPAPVRQKLAKSPPHILVTTPESLYILLTSERGRRALSAAQVAIIDEIHAVAQDKRGAHLALSLERLAHLVREEQGREPVRIGLSATQHPIERVGRLLIGAERPLPHIVDAGHARERDVAIEITDDELGAVATTEQCARVYDRIAELSRDHDTTLVFANTRRLVERVAHELEDRLGPDAVAAHHGSMSRELRLQAEKRLKRGEVRCAVATASLELGIDIGSVDLVVQIGSPRSISTFLQRVGRSGHTLGETPKGRLFALTRDQLVECAALVRALGRGRLDAVELRDAPLDILAQQIVAEVAGRGEVDEDELYRLLTASASYASLPRDSFDQVVTILAEGIATSRGRSGAHLHRDRVAGVLKPRRGARLAAITCGGAIPDNADFTVVALPDEVPVGMLDEDFAVESMAGDVFLLGNTSWRIVRVEAGRVLVEDAGGESPNVPFWLGEAPARTAELSGEISRLREEADALLSAGQEPAELASWLEGEVAMSRSAAEQMADYLASSRAALGTLPTSENIVAERFFDEGGGMQLVLHAPLGGRINRAFGLALRKRFCRGFNLELQAAATDDGVVISLGPPHSFPLEEVFSFLTPSTAAKVLEQAVLGAPVFGVRWRWNATRSLAVLRRHGGKRVAPALLRIRTDDLLAMVFPMQAACLENVTGDIEVPDHPLAKETVRDCLTEAMDADGFCRLIEGITSGAIGVSACESPEPSPLSHELLNANPYAFLDDAPLEERRARAVNLPRTLRPPDSARELAGATDEAIASAEAQAAPPVRDADELHDLLLSLIALPSSRAEPGWEAYMNELMSAGRATRLLGDRDTLWASAENLAIARAAHPGAPVRPELSPLFDSDWAGSDQDAAAAVLRGHLELCGPRPARELAEIVALPEHLVAAGLGALEAEGSVLRGQLSRRARDSGEVEYCDRRMLARVHRLTVRTLRREIEPVSPAQLMRFLFRWQRVLPGPGLAGPRGLLAAIEQLQGFESAAGAWEQDIFPARVASYDSSWLDALCLGGDVAWGRLSSRKKTKSGDGAAQPTRAAPLTFALRTDLPWLRAPAADSESAGDLSETAARVSDILAGQGASFLADLASASGEAPSAVEEALWELVAAGLVTADGFSSLRILVAHSGARRRAPPSAFDVPGAARAPRSHAWERAIRKARLKDTGRQANGGANLPASAGGRWSRLGPPDSELLDPEASARQLLSRYGVVFRELLGRETCLPPWRSLLHALRRLEARGEIRGGRFVTGFVGEQFALPEALSMLRALGPPPARGPECVRIAATDPLNLVGVTSPGPRVPAVVGNAVLYRNGVPVASREAGDLVRRGELADGETIDANLDLHVPERPVAQTSLPL